MNEPPKEIQQDEIGGRHQSTLRWQSVVAHKRNPERKRDRPTKPARDVGGAGGPGGWRPDVSSPNSYRNAGNTVIGMYSVAGDAGPGDSVSNGGWGCLINPVVELLFWGDQWRYATGPSTDDIIGAVQQLLASPYFSALSQYGFSSIRLGGSTIVSIPGPTSPTFSAKNVCDMVWALIDDDVFAEPDEDGGQTIYMVLAPNGSTYDKANARGAHTVASDSEWPSPTDHAWVGWSNNGDLDYIIDVVSHELVETITNSRTDENRGWLMSRSINGGNEIGDACNSTADRLDGLLVEGYWSEQDKACVIPWHDFSAYIAGGRPTTLSVATIDSGVAVLSVGCDQPEQPYHWWLQQSQQQVILRAEIGNLPSPSVQWTIAGRILTGNGTVTVRAHTALRDFNGVHEQFAVVTLRFSVQPDGRQLSLLNNPADGDYSFQVSYAMSSAGGSARTSRTGMTTIYFAGQDLVFDDAFKKDRSRCFAKMALQSRLLIQKEFDRTDPRLGEPPPPWVDKLADWIRGEARDRVRELLHLAHYVRRFDSKLSKRLEILADTYIPTKPNKIRLEPSHSPITGEG